MNIIICVERISRYIEGIHVRRFRDRRSRIQVSRGVFLGLRKEFEREDEKAAKVAELKRVEQGGKTMEEFVQEFRRVARGSSYKRRALVEEFKREMSRAIRRKLMETERLPSSIEQ